MNRKTMIVIAALAWALAAFPATGAEHIKVGISGGDGEEIWAKVKEIAQRQGLGVDVLRPNSLTPG